MLMPKRVKEGRRKMMRGRMKGRATQGNTVAFGDYGIVAMAPGWITSRQIEAARIAMTRHIKRGGKVWIRIFPHKSYTKKPLETRMGKGKAGVEGWVAVVKPDRVLFEMNGVAEPVAREAMRLAIHKLPMKCRFVTKAEIDKLRTEAYARTQEGLPEDEQFQGSKTLASAGFHTADAAVEVHRPEPGRAMKEAIAEGPSLSDEELGVEEIHTEVPGEEAEPTVEGEESSETNESNTENS